MKKEFQSTRAKEYNEKSDTELIDLISTEPSAIIQETAKAILDKRLKRSIQYLTEIIKENNKIAGEYNDKIAKLTTWILSFTIVMVIATIISVVKLFFL